MPSKLYVDVEAGRLVSGINDTTAPGLFAFEGDVRDYELYFLTPQTGSENFYEVLNYENRSVCLHIGPNPPSTATAYVAATAGAWSNLTSTVSATIARAVTGGVSVNEQQSLSFSPEAIGGTYSITYPSQSVTFSTVTRGVFTTSGSHGLSTGQAFVATGFSSPTGGLTNGGTLYVVQVIGRNQFFANTTVTATAVTAYGADAGGTAYTITASSTAIDAASTASQVQTALESLPSIGTGNIRVTGTPGKTYRFTFVNEKSQVALPLMTAAQALTPVFRKSATLNFNTTELLNAISASASIEATLEIETAFSGKTETVAQIPVTLNNDIISSSSTTPVVPGGGGGGAISSFILVAPNSDQWSVSIDNDGALTATKQ